MTSYDAATSGIERDKWNVTMLGKLKLSKPTILEILSTKQNICVFDDTKEVLSFYRDSKTGSTRVLTLSKRRFSEKICSCGLDDLGPSLILIAAMEDLKID